VIGSEEKPMSAGWVHKMRYYNEPLPRKISV